MFDISWIELLFVAVLALIIVGPKDMPKLFKLAGQIAGKLRRGYQTMMSGMHQLEKEIDIAAGSNQDPEPWKALMPEHLRHLPDDFLPGSMTTEQHKERRAARKAFIDQHKESTETTHTEDNAEPDSNAGRS